MKIVRSATTPSPHASRIAWPSVEPRRAKLMNVLYARGVKVELAIGGQPYELSLVPKAAGGKWGLTLNGRWNDATVAVFLPASPVLDWLAAALSPAMRGADWPRMPVELAVAAIESLLAEPLAQWSQRIGGNLELTEVSFQEKAALSGPGFLPFALSKVGDGREAQGVVAFSGDLRDFAGDGVGPEGEGGGWPAELLQEVPIEVAVEAGRTTLPIKELRSVVAGDVIVADECAAPGGACQVLIRAGRCWVGQAVLNGRSIEVRGEFMAEKPAATPSAAQPAKAMDVNELQVQVVFEIDSRLMTLKELQGVKPGMVLQTGKGLDAPVALMVNGRRFGTGELVELGGKVGVRVLELGSA